MESIKLSAFFPSIDIDVPLAKAWDLLIDYNAWNPSFANAVVTTVEGQPGAEGEIVDIKQYDVPGGTLQAHFFAETVRVIERHHFTWAVYPIEGDDFRNFVDFELLARPDGGVTFYIQYFSQTRTAEADLPGVRAGMQQAFEDLTVAFKRHAESR